MIILNKLNIASRRQGVAIQWLLFLGGRNREILSFDGIQLW